MNISLANLTMPQAVVCVALVAATVTAYKLFGEVPAAVTLVVSSVLNLLIGREAAPSVTP